MSLILLRHTAPDVAPGTCYGRTDLAPAPGFEAEAQRLAHDLPPAMRVFSSPLSRCQRLAKHIAAMRGLSLRLDDRLAEMDFGRWEGLPWDTVPRAELEAWAADFHDARPHGGESVAMLTARVAAFLGQRRTTGALVVTHAGVMRAALYLTGQDDPWQRRFAFCETLTLTDDMLAALS